MLKKLLAIAMIGTALTATAKVDMEFRDGCLNNIDGGGHFFTTVDDATGVTTFKSFNSTTTLAQIAEAFGVAESEVAPAISADPTAGPRYVRTKKPEGGNWADKGLTKEYKYLSFQYKTNTPNASIFVYFQEMANAPVACEVPMTVSEEWQTVLLSLDPYTYEGWADMPENNGKYNDYLWIVFNSWANSKDEIVLEVKDLAWLTPEEAGIAPEPPAPGTEPGDIAAPIDIKFTGTASFKPDVEAMGNPMSWIVDGGGGNALISQKFLATFPETITFFEFDYKSSEDVGPLVIYAMQKEENNPNPMIPGAGGPGINGTVLGIISIPATDIEVLDVADEGWSHVSINLLTGAGTIDGKELKVAQAFWKNTNFARNPESGDYIQIQAQGYVNETEFYIENVRLLDDPAGIEGVATDEASEVVSSEYFDLQGRQLKAAPEAGLYLRRDIRANGTANTVKVVR